MGRPQGPAEPIRRTAGVAVSALFLGTSDRCGCSTQRGAPCPGEAAGVRQRPRPSWAPSLEGGVGGVSWVEAGGTPVRILGPLAQTSGLSWGQKAEAGFSGCRGTPGLHTHTHTHSLTHKASPRQCPFIHSFIGPIHSF